jgi:ketosteroid isomerase-like protein
MRTAVLIIVTAATIACAQQLPPSQVFLQNVETQNVSLGLSCDDRATWKPVSVGGHEGQRFACDSPTAKMWAHVNTDLPGESHQEGELQLEKGKRYEVYFDAGARRWNLRLLGAAGPGSAPNATASDEIVARERAALDRWGRGDPQGFLDIYAPEITYFDPGVQRRVDGHDAMTEYYRPLTGKIKIKSYEMTGVKVQQHGDMAVLSYNLQSEAVQADGKQVTVRWNSTSVYARAGNEWKVIHSHWSITAPPCLKGTL